jgi:hypothetical protein
MRKRQEPLPVWAAPSLSTPSQRPFAARSRGLRATAAPCGPRRNPEPRRVRRVTGSRRREPHGNAWGRAADVGAAQAVSVILSTSVTALGALGSLLWWAYRRGQASGAEKARQEAEQHAQAQADAKIQVLELRVAEMQAGLASRQPKRRRLPGLAPFPDT